MNEGEQPNDFYNRESASVDTYDSTRRDPNESEGNTQAGTVSWSASEFIDHQKSATWFILLALAAFLVAGLVYFATNRDIFGPVIIIVLAIIFGAGAARRPRILEYELDDTGLNIGGKLYPYELFKAFALMHEGPVESILLLPAKRWNPSISIYYAPEDSELIINTLGSFVPLEEHKPGYSDRFLHKIRF